MYEWELVFRKLDCIMKKIAYWNNYVDFAHNKAFDAAAYGIGEDLGYPIILLKKILAEHGYLLETLDMDSPEKYEAVIFSDYPNPKTCCVDINSIHKEKRFLILEECEMLYKPNARNDLLNEFHKVFAYNDELVQNCGYIKLNIVNKIKKPLFVPFSNKNFATLIAGNKHSKDRGELYSERLKAIHFMEKEHPRDFDLYGMGWNERKFTGPKLIRALNRLHLLKIFLTKKHLCYKGRCERKLEVLSKYKFCFCYENTCVIPGYISEKIWDCFFAGCVPIYYGAPNIDDYIPGDIFIDFRNFKSYAELYEYLKNITEEEYEKYLLGAKEFLISKKAYLFSAEYFVETMIKEILEK